MAWDWPRPSSRQVSVLPTKQQRHDADGVNTALAVQQMAINIDILQLIFSFTVLGVLLFSTCLVIILRIFGKELSIIRYDDEAVTVGERRFLLDDE